MSTPPGEQYITPNFEIGGNPASEATTTTSLKSIFRFPFQSPKWQSHFIIGIVLIWAGFLIPIVPGIFVYGYILRVMREALNGLVSPAVDRISLVPYTEREIETSWV